MTTALVPIARETLADMETPVSAYWKLAHGEAFGTGPAFLLESVEGGETLGRYSFLGFDPIEEIVARGEGDPLHAIRTALGRYRLAEVGEGGGRFLAGAVGYLSYDAVRHFERVPRTKPDVLGLPEAAFFVPGVVVVFDHVRRRMRVVAHALGEDEVARRRAETKLDAVFAALAKPLARPAPPPAPPDPAVVDDPFAGAASNVARGDFEAAVAKAKRYIEAGDVFQVVLSQRFSRPSSAPPLDLYRALRAVNPSPYMFLLHHPDLSLDVVGSSPEVMVRLEDGRITLRPIAGTRRRGATPEEDAALERELLADPKERAEHLMLVDLGRNDVGRVAKTGSVGVTDFMTIERYSHVLHIVSNVTGELAEGRDAFDLLRATFPAGTVSGAPKVRAMEIIDELEPDLRGPYAGAVGYFDLRGNCDTAITLRTILATGGTVHVQAGAGIVADSDSAAEYEECRNKARGMLAAVAWAERGFA